jgi:hypothetical protein
MKLFANGCTEYDPKAIGTPFENCDFRIDAVVAGFAAQDEI